MKKAREQVWPEIWLTRRGIEESMKGLRNADEIVIDAQEEVTLCIDYPLSNPVEVPV